jgi:GrpB-like predicted nucleotidyltransferase (UPF0157 family)
MLSREIISMYSMEYNAKSSSKYPMFAFAHFGSTALPRGRAQPATDATLVLRRECDAAERVVEALHALGQIRG